MTAPTAGAAGPVAGVDDSRISPELMRLALVVVLGTIMSIFDTTIVNVGIETLGRDFHSTLSTIQWVVTGYLLALAVVIPLTGWSVDRYGTKTMWMASLTLFLCGSMLCGVAWSAGSLIVFRLLQGLGGGLIMPIGQTILAQAAGPQRMGRLMSIIGVPMLLGPILGPVLGGVIVDNLSWRWMFFVNVPVGIIAILAAWRVLPSGEHRPRGRLDLLGFALVSPGLGALVYGLSEAGNGAGFTSPRAVVGILVGVVLVGAFIRHALRTESPLIDLRLFRNRGFTTASVVSFFVAGGLFGAMFLLPLYYQVVRGQSALTAGLLMAPQGLAAMITMPVAGRIVDRVGARPVVPLGAVLLAAGTLLYTQVGAHTSETWLALSLFVRGLGFGLCMMPATAAAYQTLRHAQVPSATTLINIVTRVAGSLGTAILAVVLQRQILAGIPSASGGISSLPAGDASLAPALAGAFGHAFWWAFFLAVVALIPALFLPRGRQGPPEELEAAEPVHAGEPVPVP